MDNFPFLAHFLAILLTIYILRDIIVTVIKMKNSICRFMPAKDYTDSIKTVNFVYEAEFKRLRQPFFKPIYSINLVTRGNGKLICDGMSFQLEKGFIFFNFPGTFFSIDAGNDFEFAYISFMGDDVDSMLGRLGVTKTTAVFEGFGHITDIWLTSLRRLDEFDANLLTESMLFYTLSFLGKYGKQSSLDEKDALFSGITDYLEKHFTDPDISLGRVSGIFGYTQKYFSLLFKNNMGTGFCEYINNMRMKHALSLIDDGVKEVSKVSEMCGFTDPLYFSKVFKKYNGVSPRDYINKKT